MVAAARLCDAAGPGELLLSRTAADLVGGSELRVTRSRKVTLKGLGEFDAYTVDD